MKPFVVGLYSPAPQSGKTATASYLAGLGYTRLSFASPIKRMARVLLNELGYSSKEAYRLLHEAKEEKLELISTTTRHILQTLGTEFGRGCVHPSVWVMCAERALVHHLDEGRPVVIDDVRFPNEAALIRKYGGEMWLITRPGTERPNSHASEGGLSDINFDRHIENNGSLMDLYRNVDFISQTYAA